MKTNKKLRIIELDILNIGRFLELLSNYTNIHSDLITEIYKFIKKEYPKKAYKLIKKYKNADKLIKELNQIKPIKNND